MQQLYSKPKESKEGSFFNESNESEERVGNVVSTMLKNLENINSKIENGLSYNNELNPNHKVVVQAKKTVLPFLKEVIDNNDFCVRFRSLEKRRSGGGFKSCISTKIKDISYVYSRKKFALDTYGVDYDDTSNVPSEVYEKYGYLANYKDSNKEDGCVDCYGKYKAKLNKKKLLNNTTFILGDSLINKGSSRPSRVSNPQACSIPEYINGNYEPLLLLCELIESKTINNTTSPYKICEELSERYERKGMEYCDLSYIELQFLGPVPWGLVDEYRDTDKD